MRNEIFNYLERSPASRHLPEKVFIKTYKKGELIYRPPSRLNYFYEVVEGAVKLGCYKENEQEFSYELIEAGEFFGNLQYLDGQFAEWSKALMPTAVRCYELSFFKDIILRDAYITQNFLVKLTSRWCRAENRMILNASTEPRARIRHVYDLTSKYIAGSDGANYFLPHLLTYKDIADLTGTTRQLVAEVLRMHQTAPACHKGLSKH